MAEVPRPPPASWPTQPGGLRTARQGAGGAGGRAPCLEGHTDDPPTEWPPVLRSIGLLDEPHSPRSMERTTRSQGRHGAKMRSTRKTGPGNERRTDDPPGRGRFVPKARLGNERRTDDPPRSTRFVPKADICHPGRCRGELCARCPDPESRVSGVPSPLRRGNGCKREGKGRCRFLPLGV